MVDLRVREEHAGHRWRANAAALPGRERLELLAGVRRRVHEEPRPLAATDRQRRLRPRSRPHTGARRLARLATAVPLWESAAGGRTEDASAHETNGSGRSLRRRA